MIVRDEEKTLPGALASVCGSPEVVVCDTGSRDATRDIARKAGARVVEFTWCNDFSTARSYAESNATHDWILRLDADERIKSFPPRIIPAEKKTGIHLPCGPNFIESISALLGQTESEEMSQVFIRRRHSPGNDHWFPRMHRRSRFRWFYPVHELIKPKANGWEKSTALDGFIVEHERDKRPRPYREILERALSDSPCDAYLAFHFGQACFEEQNWSAAISAFNRYQSIPGGYRFHRGEALRMEAESWEHLGDFDRAISTYMNATQAEGRAEPLWQAAQLAFRIGRHEIGQELFAQGSRLMPPEERQPFGAIDYPYVTDWRCYKPDAWKIP